MARPDFFFFNFQDSLRVDLIFIFSPFADYYGRSEVIPEKTNCRIAALRGTGNSQQRTAGVVFLCLVLTRGFMDAIFSV